MPFSLTFRYLGIFLCANMDKFYEPTMVRGAGRMLSLAGAMRRTTQLSNDIPHRRQLVQALGLASCEFGISLWGRHLQRPSTSANTTSGWTSSLPQGLARWEAAVENLACTVFPDRNTNGIIDAVRSSRQHRSDLMALLGWQSPWFRAMLRGLRIFSLHMLPTVDCFGDVSPLAILLAVMWMYCIPYVPHRNSRSPVPRRDAARLVRNAWTHHLRQWLRALTSAKIICGDILDLPKNALPSAWEFYWNKRVNEHRQTGALIPSVADLTRGMSTVLNVPPCPPSASPLPAALRPPGLPIFGGENRDAVQLLQDGPPGSMARFLTRALADVSYATQGSTLSSCERPPSSCSLHAAMLVRPAYKPAVHTCVSPDCLFSPDWRPDARCVTKPLRPVSASAVAAFLVTPARSNRHKVSIVRARLIVDRLDSCPRCEAPVSSAVWHLLWVCDETAQFRDTLYAELESLVFHHRISRALSANQDFLHALILGELDSIFSKPPMDARTTAACLAEGQMPVGVVSNINAATCTPVFREVVHSPESVPVFSISPGGVRISLETPVPPNGQFIDCSWPSARQLLPPLGDFLVHCVDA